MNSTVNNEAILYCAPCRGIFDRNTVEVVPQTRFEESASHGMCPSCKERLLRRVGCLIFWFDSAFEEKVGGRIRRTEKEMVGEKEVCLSMGGSCLPCGKNFIHFLTKSQETCLWCSRP